MRNREEFLKLASTKISNFKVPSLNNYEVTLKELTIAESKEFGEIAKTKDMQKAIIYACRCSCVEPEFFTDEELENLGSNGLNATMEIYSEIPLIGKTEEEREEYKKKLAENAKSIEEKETSKEDEKKQLKKSENSSSN